MRNSSQIEGEGDAAKKKFFFFCETSWKLKLRIGNQSRKSCVDIMKYASCEYEGILNCCIRLLSREAASHEIEMQGSPLFDLFQGRTII